MSPENMKKLMQAYPNLFQKNSVNCDDKWFPLLMSVGARLEEAVKAAHDEDSLQVAAVKESEKGLEVRLNREDSKYRALVDDCLSSALPEGHAPESQHPYLWTHNLTEQTSAEEAVRADMQLDDPSVDKLREETVRAAQAAGGPSPGVSVGHEHQ